MKKSVLFIALIIILMVGCSKNQYEYNDENSNNPYSREHISWLCQSNSFGTRRSDDETLALKYLYDSQEISEIYGDTFQITDDKIVCHKSESHSFFIPGIFKGEAIYEFIFEDESYTISLSKSYFGEWTVEKCEQNDYELVK